ncbi:hypothetical protein BvCmsG79A_04880 [Escherichia coli]|nr:hypothetical protein BvCmsG79A_04880 [Escherichia coli]GCJ27222.1 hypothetical protein BvCmsK146A_04437 [Escherichia coli]GCK38032.1 hypothetical protein BvCmsB39A_04629 [Escherichia coli]GCL07092.1 hypothetical protein BvCmsC100A_04737 [Escherichia coli]GCL11896.1 hypothetical protein BvCmsD61A_04659 [Escherichia coli]
MFYKLLSKLIFAVLHRAEGCSRQQMAGQFHLADHFDLRVERRVPGMCLAGEGCIVLWCIRCAPEHTIDGQQGQAAPLRMRRGVMPELRCFREHAADSLTSQALAGLNNGTGGNEGAIARQHDVQAIHNLVKRFFTLKRHANNTPDHHFEGKTALA